MSEREVQLEAELTRLRQKLRAVSDALDETIGSVDGHFFLTDLADDSDALLARLRAIVEGK